MQLERYDAVVIGAGIGGMCAAALLVKEGYKTLVVEMLDHMGGRFSTEEVDGYRLRTGGCGIHFEGMVPKVFKEVGAKLDIRPNKSELCYRLHGVDHWVSLESRGVKAMLDILGKTDVNRTSIMGGLAKEIAGEKILGAFQRSKDSSSKEKGTVREWLLRYTDNQDLHNFFDMTTANMGMGRSYEFPAAAFFYFMANIGGMADTGVVPQGTIQIYDELAKVVKSNGDIWLGSPAKKILVKKGSVTGVVIQKDGSEEIEVSCKVIISNVGPQMTSQLADYEGYDDKYLTDMRVKMRPVPVTMFAIGSEKRLWPPEGKTSGHLTPLGMRRITACMAITESCPEMAPPGHHLLYFVATPPSTLCPMNPEVEISEIKLDLEELFPDYERYGKILKIETRNIDHFLPEGRSWQSPSFCMSYKTPVKNLYDVGDGVISGGAIGSSGSAESAKKAVDLIKKTVKR